MSGLHLVFSWNAPNGEWDDWRGDVGGMNWACVRTCTGNSDCTIQRPQSTDIACTPGTCGENHYCDNAGQVTIIEATF